MTDPSSTPRRIRVLLVTRNLPPLRGGMERLNRHMALELARDFDVTVVGPHGCRACLPDSIDAIEVGVKPLWWFFAGTIWKSIVCARRMRPHVVLAGSGLTAPFAWLAAKLAGARMLVYVHGLDLIADHVVYRRCWRPFIRRTDLCIANSRNTQRLAESIGVPASRIAIVHPGVEMPTSEADTGNAFRARFELGERPLLLSVGRLIARKGLLEFVESGLPLIVAKVPDACLLVLGDEAPDFLQGSSIGLGDRIRQRAADLGLQHNLRFIGPQDDATLASAYRAADVHVFPVREVAGDVEGFGMVAIEAAAHGLPTVAFAVGGVPDAVVDGVSGHLVPAGDYPRFATQVINSISGNGRLSMRESAQEFASRFAWPTFGEKMRQHVRRILEAAT